ncbi:CHAT domain-containing protein [Phormidium tenue FACHB-886]|nr:CHAT domain-containing protein [Phormidium tenue FACHB-886]
MDRQRLQAYDNLIEQLLNCADWENIQTVLQHHSELLDAGLLIVMQQYAAQFEQQGNNHVARWLSGLAGQLTEALRTVEIREERSLQNSEQFLLAVLQLMGNSDGDDQQVYSVLAQHQDQFTESLLQALPQVAARLLASEPEQQQIVATDLANFGDLLQLFPSGKRWLNLELSIVAYQSALQIYTRESYPHNWARAQTNMATACCQRVYGDRVENLERAVDAYGQALSVFTRNDFPEDWKMIWQNLAVISQESARNEAAQYLAIAINLLMQRTTSEMPKISAVRFFTELLRISGNGRENTQQLYSFLKSKKDQLDEDFLRAIPTLVVPAQTDTNYCSLWLAIMIDLGRLIQEFPVGDRALNLEIAIAIYEQALKLATRANFPVQRGILQNNLGNVYKNRIRGGVAENIEKAITTFKEALQVRTQRDFPQYWATTQNNLGNAYIERIRGDRTDNIEQAIAAFEKALQVFTRSEFPEYWAMLQMNLATAYRDRIAGKQADNIEQSISTYEDALQIYTLSDFPEDWAMIQRNLGGAYRQTYRGDRATNIELAIAAFEKALQVFTYTDFPEDWAKTHIGLGIAYTDRIRGSRTDNLERAINAYQLALQVYTRETFPQSWAMIQHNLANTYFHSYHIKGEHTNNLEQAISAFNSALQIYTPETFPKECRGTARTLGDLYFLRQRWIEAAQAYKIALVATESLYHSALFLSNQTIELSQTGNLYHRAAYAFAKTNDLPRAVLTLEQGRARSLSDTLARERAELAQLQFTAPDLSTRFQQGITQLRNLEEQQRNFDNSTAADRRGINFNALRQQLTQTRQNLDEVIAAIQHIEGYETFLKPPTFADIICTCIPDRGTVYLNTTATGSLALILCPNANIHPIWLDELTQEVVEQFVKDWFSAYGQQQEDRQGWLAGIDQITQRLWSILMAPLVQQLTYLHLAQAVLIATGYLGLLPLHAAWTTDPTTSTGRRYAFDDIHFTYTPNARSLNAAVAIAQRTGTDSILAIDNPLKDLPNSSREVTAAVDTFSQHKVLKHEEATIGSVLNALSHYNILHLSCHGTANLLEPLNSGLAMSDGLLTLRNLLDLRLIEQGGIRLAILSACETGLVGIELMDEAIGLPTGLLQAGVSGVVASLWSVSDLSTMMLLVRFYDLWRKDKLNPAVALRQAQQWVRDTTSQQKAKYFKDTNPDMFQSLILLDPNYFAHPFHWAAFSYVGV